MANCAFCGRSINLKDGIAHVYEGKMKFSFCWPCNLDGKIEEYLDRLEDAKYNSADAQEHSNYS